MKYMMQFFTALHVFFYRLSGGKFGGRMGAGNILLLDSIGRKSGKARTTPVMYIQEGTSYVVAASAGGGPVNPGWYHNLRTAGSTTIQVMGNKMTASVVEADPVRRDQLWAKIVAAMPQFKGYETRTTRKIPLLILTPR